MLNSYDQEEIWCHYICSKLSNIMVTNSYASRAQFTDGLCVRQITNLTL